MSSDITIDQVTIRTTLQPGDIGYVTYRHGKLYSDEYGYGISFEAYVAASTAFGKALREQRCELTV